MNIIAPYHTFSSLLSSSLSLSPSSLHRHRCCRPFSSLVVTCVIYVTFFLGNTAFGNDWLVKNLDRTMQGKTIYRSWINFICRMCNCIKLTSSVIIHKTIVKTYYIMHHMYIVLKTASQCVFIKHPYTPSKMLDISIECCTYHSQSHYLWTLINAPTDRSYPSVPFW